MIDAVPLQVLQTGDSARVAHIAGQHELRHRLHEMGLAEGKRFEVVQAGSPCILRINGQKLCFRAEELIRVMVVRDDRAQEGAA